ncbi:ribonuclease H-like domain-containing protein [Tanacetum coccineum]|uniref:Ribonuclease H-like domain-containing protein n=1 Tax=Tanacetum coccineum TaxID=301880 RepID=A0ABQ5HB01_9ASTR
MGNRNACYAPLTTLPAPYFFKHRIPPSYWVEALNMVAHLLNILPSTAINNEIPFTKLHNKPPTYDHLRVFGCLCYPHISFDHKLQPRSTACVFLGYPALHRGYRCLDLSNQQNHNSPTSHLLMKTNSLIGSMTPDTPPSYDFLLPPHNTHTSQTTHPNNHQLHPPTAMPPSPTHTSPTQSPQAQPQSPHHPLTPRTRATHQQIPVPPLSSTHEPTTPSSTPNTHITSPVATAYGNAPTTNTHHMVTRAQAEFQNLMRALVPRPANVNIVLSMWLFKHKFNADGSLSSEFAMTDLGSLNYFLGVSAQRSKSGLFLSQTKFAEEILERAHMQHFVFCAYVRGTHDHDSALFHPLIQLTAYTDADWLDCLLLVGLPPVLCVLDCVIRNLLLELHIPLFTTTLVYCDNVSAVYLSTNHVQHQRTKHIEIDIHLIENMLLPSGFVCFMSLPDFSMQIFLLRVSPQLYFLSFAPA